MRLEKVMVNGEVLYRQIPEENEQACETGTEPTKERTNKQSVKGGVDAARSAVQALGRLLDQGAQALGKKVFKGISSVFSNVKKEKTIGDRELIRLLPHLDREGRHDVYLKLRANPKRLDEAQLSALLPYLSKEDFDDLCAHYREK